MDCFNNTEPARSARDVLLRGYKKTDVLAEKVVYRKPLSGATKYAYCPYCCDRIRRGGGNWQSELKPIHQVKVELLCDRGEEAEIIDEWRYECTVCKDIHGRNRVLDWNDFIMFYGAPYQKKPVRTVKKTDDVVDRFLGVKS